MKRKITYKAKPIVKILLPLTGNIYLQYEDEDAIAAAVKGDLMLHPRCDALHTTRQGDYFSTGMAGYFKIDVYDGREWRAVLINEIFPHREHHFSKTECPIDTYELCKEILATYAGKNLQRTYREHYFPEGSEEPQEE